MQNRLRWHHYSPARFRAVSGSTYKQQSQGSPNREMAQEKIPLLVVKASECKAERRL
jgi:hypothetical protein